MTVLSVREKRATHFQVPWFLRNLLPFCVKTSPPGGNESSLWPIFSFFSSSSSFESYCEVLVWTLLVLSYAHQHFESEPLRVYQSQQTLSPFSWNIFFSSPFLSLVLWTYSMKIMGKKVEGINLRRVLDISHKQGERILEPGALGFSQTHYTAEHHGAPCLRAFLGDPGHYQ